MEQAGLTAPLVIETMDTYPHSREAREPFEELATRTGRTQDHNQTIFALAGPSERGPTKPTDPPGDRLLRLWRKRIRTKLSGADELVRNGCE